MLLEQALVSKETLNDMPGCPRYYKDWRDAPTSQPKCRHLVEKRECQQQTDIETESQLENLSDSDCEVEKGNGGQ